VTSEAAAVSGAPDDALLDEIEAHAVALARAAGEEATRALSREIEGEYKTEAKGDRPPSDPVSEVDRAVEQTIRERVGQHFPDHDILGEEVDDHPSPDAEFVWVIDPIDGTTNFVNGFPLFAVSIGVLYRGEPVVGAVWTSTGHRLRSGVYHARRGGTLRFDDEPVDGSRASAGVKRRLSAAPGGSPGGIRQWDHRITGCAAIEGSFVAAGIFQSATFWGARIWDVAAVVTLVQAAGHEAWVRGRDGWAPLERFTAPERVKEDREPSLRDWRQPLILGTAEAATVLRERSRGPGLLRRLRLRMRRMLGRRGH